MCVQVVNIITHFYGLDYVHDDGVLKHTNTFFLLYVPHRTCTTETRLSRKSYTIILCEPFIVSRVYRVHSRTILLLLLQRLRDFYLHSDFLLFAGENNRNRCRRLEESHRNAKTVKTADVGTA